MKQSLGSCEFHHPQWKPGCNLDHNILFMSQYKVHFMSHRLTFACLKKIGINKTKN